MQRMPKKRLPLGLGVMLALLTLVALVRQYQLRQSQAEHRQERQLLDAALSSQSAGPEALQAAVGKLAGGPVKLQIADGDLTGAMGSHAQDELDALLESLGRMQTKLVTLVGQVRSEAEFLANASKEIAYGNRELSARTEKQASLAGRAGLQHGGARLHRAPPC
jgi:methyl-accepting chemotaxis protein